MPEAPARLVQARPEISNDPIDIVHTMTGMGGGAWAQEASDYCGDEACFFITRADKRVDVGSWFGFPKLWILVLEGGLVLGAWGRFRLSQNPYTLFLPWNIVHTAIYNDITGSINLSLNGAEEVPDLPMQPVQGYQLLAHIEQRIHS